MHGLHRWRRFAALGILCILPSLPALSQGVVRGTVTSAADGAPLAFVHVYITALQRGAITDDDGRFVLDGLPPGSYTLVFSRVGFAKATIPVDVSPGTPVRLGLALAGATAETGELVVVADRLRPRAEIPLTTYSFDESRRLETGAMSLWAALDRLPGVARSSAGPGIERPLLRGLSGGRILVMLEGLPYAYQTWDPELGLNTDGNGTEQVDVIQGPATLQYGPGAMGGVVSLLPEYPAPVGSTVGSYTLGLASNSEGLYNALSVRHSGSGTFWGARVGFDSHADYRPGGEENEAGVDAEAEVPNSRFNHLEARAFGGLSRSWGSTRLTYRLMRHRNGIIESEEEEEGRMEEEGRDIEPPFHAVDDHLLSSDTRLRLGDGWLDAVVGLQVNEQKETEPVPGSVGEREPAIELLLTTVHLRLGYERPLRPGWTLQAGFQGFVQGNESEGDEPFVPNADAHQGGVFGLVRGRAGRMLIEGGLRVDVHTLDTSAPTYERDIPADEEVSLASGTWLIPSGSLGLTLQPSAGSQVRLNVGAGGAAPSLAALTANGPLREIRRFIVGDPDLDAEHNLEADVSATLRSGPVELTGSTFVNRIVNYTHPFATGDTESRSFEGQPFEFPVFAYRQEDATFWGGHVGASVRPLAGTRLYTRLDLVLGRLKDADDSWLPMMPAHHVLTGIEWRGTAWGALRHVRASVELDTYLEQDRVAAWESASQGYALLDVSLGAEIPMWAHAVQVGLHALNLFDEAYVSHLSLLKQDGIRDVGRNVTLTVRVPFGGS